MINTIDVRQLQRDFVAQIQKYMIDTSLPFRVWEREKEESGKVLILIQNEKFVTNRFCFPIYREDRYDYT